MIKVHFLVHLPLPFLCIRFQSKVCHKALETLALFSVYFPLKCTWIGIFAVHAETVCQNILMRLTITLRSVLFKVGARLLKNSELIILVEVYGSSEGLLIFCPTFLRLLNSWADHLVSPGLSLQTLQAVCALLHSLSTLYLVLSLLPPFMVLPWESQFPHHQSVSRQSPVSISRPFYLAPIRLHFHVFTVWGHVRCIFCNLCPLFLYRSFSSAWHITHAFILFHPFRIQLISAFTLYPFATPLFFFQPHHTHSGDGARKNLSFLSCLYSHLYSYECVYTWQIEWMNEQLNAPGALGPLLRRLRSLIIWHEEGRCSAQRRKDNRPRNTTKLRLLREAREGRRSRETNRPRPSDNRTLVSQSSCVYIHAFIFLSHLTSCTTIPNYFISESTWK